MPTAVAKAGSKATSFNSFQKRATNPAVRAAESVSAPTDCGTSRPKIGTVVSTA